MDFSDKSHQHKWMIQTKFQEKEVLHMFLALFVKKGRPTFAYLTLKWTF